MEIISNSLPMSARVKEGLAYIEESRFHKKSFWAEDGLSVLNKNTINLPLIKRKALADKKILYEIPIEIADYELIVGSVVQGSTQNWVPIPDYATKEEKAAAAKKYTGPSSVFGHFEPCYPRVLRMGLTGIQKLAQEKLEKAKERRDTKKSDWYESVLISLSGVERYILRVAETAQKQAQKTTDQTRKDELTEIAKICRNLTERPPQTFREALQLFWFVEIAVNSCGHWSPLGRFDQNLWPFLKKDLDNGAINLEQAQELVDLTWLKINERLQSLDVVEKKSFFLPNPAYQNSVNEETAASMIGMWSLTLGGRTTHDRFTTDGAQYNQFFTTMALSGTTPNGEDGTNPLTYMALNATFRLKLVQPEMYVRLHKNSPPELYERTTELLGDALANPTIFNDEATIPAFVKEGYPLEVAREYTSDGCWEAHPQGVTYFKYGFLSCIEVVDRMINHDFWDKAQVSFYLPEFDPFKNIDIPDPRSYKSFEEVMNTYRSLFDTQVKSFIETVVSMRDERLYDIAPLPLLSAFVEGPLETGRDITQFGMPYTQHSIVLSGLSHAADSLAVINKLCFEENVIGLPELVDAIRNNWEGKETLRRLVQTRVAAYGNDIDYVDNIAKEIVEFFVDSIKRHKQEVKTDFKFAPGIATFEGYTIIGRLVGATADGRLAKEPISSNASPSVGRAANGQTAALNSYLKLPHTDLPAAGPLDLAMAPRKDMHERLLTLIKTFVAGGGSCLTVSVNDCRKLKAAQKEPEKYRDLKVRVGGWEAYFVDLPPHYQDWQIKKCEQYSR